MDRVKRFWKRFKEGLNEVGYNLYEAWKNGYYPFFIILLLISTQSYGQSSEKAQKQAKVIERREQSTPQYQNPSTTVLQSSSSKDLHTLLLRPILSSLLESVFVDGITELILCHRIELLDNHNDLL